MNEVISFLADTLMWFGVIVGVLVALAIVVAPLVVAWRYKWSIKVVDKDEVAVPLFLGEPGHICNEPGNILCKSGPQFVPYCFGFKWDGHSPWELVRITTKIIPLNYEITEKNKVWSLDNQLLMVQATLYISFPYDDIDSLGKMIKAGVPTTDYELTEWAEDVVIPALRQVLSKLGYRAAISRVNLDKINKDVNKILQQDKGLLRDCGVFGADHKVRDPGTGTAYMEVEQVLLTPELQAKLQKVETAKLDVGIAQSVAKAQAKNAGVVAIAYSEWLKTPEGQAANGEMKKQVFEAIRQGKLSADGHYNEQISRNLIGSPDGSPLPSGLTYLSLGGGGGAGVLFGNKPGKNSGSTKRKKVEAMTPDEKRVELEE